MITEDQKRQAYNWISLDSTGGLNKLTAHIPVDYQPASVVKRLETGISRGVKNVLVEHNYVDKDYRSTFYSFYAKKGQRYLPDCVRLHFFDGLVTFDEKLLRLNCGDAQLADHYFGYMVLRPTGIATIGRTVLSPDVRNGASHLIITASHKVHLLGYELRVDGFPSMAQHADISVCAHVACWSILRHYSERWPIYREFLTYDITMMAHEFDPGGLVPSKGLQVAHAERVFQEAGTYPLLITRSDGAEDDRPFYRQLVAYVDSGFPLFAAMSGQKHAVAVVGYEWKSPSEASGTGVRYAWDEVQSLAVVDDNYLPYLSVPATGARNEGYGAQDIDTFIVALPEKVFYPADAVDRLGPTLFKLGPIIGLPPQDHCIVRYFITTGAALRHFVRLKESEFDPKLLEAIMKLPFAQFLWVVELATQAQWAVGQVEARALIDATASLVEDVPFWLLHSRTNGLIFDRQRVGGAASGMGLLSLTDMGHSGYSRFEQNLRLTQSK